MRLEDFVESHLTQIVAEWEQFATTIWPRGGTQDTLVLRDHAEDILRAVAADMRTTQTELQRRIKGRGEAARGAQSPQTAAETHAVLRAVSGFSVQQLVSEYRALRASVLRLWGEAHPIGPDVLEQVGRFNEGIDQAIAESVQFFAVEVERWRNVFLGVLGHDLRSPLNAIMLTSQYLAKLTDGSPSSAHASRLIRSGHRMKELLDDLLDYSRTSLELGIRISPMSMDLAETCREEVALQQLAHPDARIDTEIVSPTLGRWDASRIRQLLANLITNAVKYGDADRAVKLQLRSAPEGVQLVVENEGPSIPPESFESLFEPLKRGSAEEAGDQRTSLGLGLFIVREIARAHGGTVTLQSADGRTAFTVALPWAPPAAPVPPAAPNGPD